MYIKKAYLENYGKFHEKTIYFSPGLNVVYGENESGKSTLHSFLLGMLFGMEKQRGRASATGAYQKYEPWNSSAYYTGSMEISVGNKEFILERNFYHKERSARLYNQREQEELSVEQGDLTMLLGGVGRRFYENTCCISQAGVLTETDFADALQQQFMNQIYGGEQNLDIRRAQRQLEAKKRAEEQALRKLEQQRRQQQERLEWEQEILSEDIRQIQERLLLAQEQELQAAQGAEKNTVKEHGSERVKQSFWWRIPILGQLLRWLYGLWNGKMGKNSHKKKENVVPQREALSQEQKDYHAVCTILREQLTEKEMHLYNLQEELAELMTVSENEQDRLTEIKSIQLAAETLQQVSQEFYRDSRDRLQASVSEIFSAITEGVYNRVEIDAQGRMLLYCGAKGQDRMLWQEESDQSVRRERCLEPWQLSRGTMEQLYFALRLGTGRSLIQEEALPVLLDEVFGAYDDLRLRRTLHWLAAQKEQMILFTCQSRELQLLDDLGVEYHRILL